MQEEQAPEPQVEDKQPQHEETPSFAVGDVTIVVTP